MKQDKWLKWVMQTATTLEDLDGVVKNTGIERIDREHFRLVEYILEMGEELRYSDNSTFDSQKLEKQKVLLYRFLSALKSHFKTEEYYISKYALDGKSLQEHEHDEILKSFQRIIADFEAGILSTFQVVRIGLLSELVRHINGVDRQTFLLENFLPIIRGATCWADVSGVIKSTGLPFVDEEHEDLTVRILDLKEYLFEIECQITIKSHKEKILGIIKQLFEYTQIHFDHEEEFLKNYDLDDEKHIRLHRIFLSHIFDVGRKIENNHEVDLRGFVDFLLSWWIDHINGNDFVEFHFTRIAEPVFKKSKTVDDFDWLIRKVGDEKIDKEHVTLIGLLLEINQKIASKEEIDVEKELAVITSFAAKHFVHEEAIMAQKDLDADGVHADAHQKLLGYVGDAVKHAVAGRSQISASFLNRLMRWWIEHTNGLDYDTFVMNKSIK